MTATATATATMQAIVRDHYGNADVLRLAQVTRPEPTDNEALLRVKAAGLDRGTWHMMTGKPYLGRLVFGLPRPKNPTLGIDVAGIVVAVGATTGSTATWRRQGRHTRVGRGRGPYPERPTGTEPDALTPG